MKAHASFCGGSTARLAGTCILLALTSVAWSAQKTAEPRNTQAKLVRVEPDKPNALKFAPRTARFVRVFIQESEGGQPCLDELEVYGPGSATNLALASRGAKASASS